ncbi:MAG: PASTA domain-containing protein [Nonlabens sp.]
MFTKTFWIQVLLAIFLVVALCFVYLFWLDWYTNHDQRIEVPSLERKTLSVADQELEELELRRKIIDSSSYNPDFPPRTIIEQDPRAGSFVKEDRQIYIKLNASGYGLVTVPNLVFKTKRQAVPTLEALGFKVGELTYKPDVSLDMVLEMNYKGREVKLGERLKKTSVIDLVLGDGNREEDIDEDSGIGMDNE